MNADRERAFLERVRSTLDAGVRDLDTTVVARLEAARRRALASERAHRFRLPLWVPGIAVALAVALAVLLTVGRPSTSAESAAAARLEAVDLLASGEGLDLYEDLDFYAWLANDPGQG